jgi:hypothetical protein
MRVPFANWRIALCSVANESLDTFFGEAFQFYLALPHPPVERSHKPEFEAANLTEREQVR